MTSTSLLSIPPPLHRKHIKASGGGSGNDNNNNDKEEHQDVAEPLTIASIAHLLDAFNHRHKNQHRVSHWWSSFSILRRSVRDLLPFFPSGDHKRSIREADASRVQSRVRHLRHQVLPKVYVTFTQLAADNQHAALGVMLLAVLARVHTVTTDLLPLDLTPPSNLSRPSETKSFSCRASYTTKSTAVDKGVVISRDNLLPYKSVPSIQENRPTTQSPQLPAKKAPKRERVEDNDTPAKQKGTKKAVKKKKKGGGDELSSLFGSLT